MTEIKQTTDWSDESFPVVELAFERTVKKIYLSDKDGNEVSGPSKFVTVEMEISPSEGSPIYYNAHDFFNHWSEPYNLSFVLSEDAKLTTNNEPVTALDVDVNYTKKTTNADALTLDQFTASDNVSYSYGEYVPEDGTNTLVVWLHGSGEGGTQATDPYVTALSNEVTSLLSDEFQKTVGNAAVLVPQCPTFWMDEDGDGGEWENGLLVPTEDCYYTKSLQELI